MSACTQSTAPKAALPEYQSDLLLWRPLQNGQPEAEPLVTLQMLADH